MPTTPDRVRKIIAHHLSVDIGRVTEEADLAGDLGADSLDIIELQIAFEEEFAVNIGDDKVDEWQTAGDIVRTVEGLRA